MRPFTHYFTRVHLLILVSFTLMFSLLTVWWLSHQSPSDRRENWNVATTVFTFTGPFAGAIARHFQACCWRFSLGLFPYCAGFLLLGIIGQIVPLPFQNGQRPFRIGAWTLGLLGWLLGAPVSFLHALC
jgi:hypothetical protein